MGTEANWGRSLRLIDDLGPLPVAWTQSGASPYGMEAVLARFLTAGSPYSLLFALEHKPGPP